MSGMVLKKTMPLFYFIRPSVTEQFRHYMPLRHGANIFKYLIFKEDLSMNQRNKFLAFFILIPLTLCLFSRLSQAQAIANKLQQTGKTLQEFIPQEWSVKAKAEGDLNKDGLNDIAAVLINDTMEKNNTDETDLTRLLIILFKNSDGTLKLSAASEKAILCNSCGGVFGDPFESIKIEKGVLVISHYGGSSDRWAYVHRFRFQDGDWFLIGRTETNMNVNTLEGKSVDENLITGLAITETTAKGGKKTNTTQTKMPVKPLIKLKNFDINKDLG